MNLNPPERQVFDVEKNLNWQKSMKSMRKSEKKEAKKGENRKNPKNSRNGAKKPKNRGASDKIGENYNKPTGIKCVDAVNKPIETAVITPCSNFLRRMRRKDIRQVG